MDHSLGTPCSRTERNLVLTERNLVLKNLGELVGDLAR
jgi:hypothetical protein